MLNQILNGDGYNYRKFNLEYFDDLYKKKPHMDFNEIMDIVYPKKRKIFKKDSPKYDLGPEYASLKSMGDGRNEAYAYYLLKTFPNLQNKFDELYDITYPRTRKSKTFKTHWLKENGYIKNKPPSAYNLFVKEYYNKVKKAYPNFSQKNILKELGELWQYKKDNPDESIDEFLNNVNKETLPPKEPRTLIINLPKRK